MEASLTLLSIVDRMTRWKINKFIEDSRQESKTTRPSTYLYNTPPNKSRLLLCYTWSIFQDKPHIKP